MIHQRRHSQQLAESAVLTPEGLRCLPEVHIAGSHQRGQGDLAWLPGPTWGAQVPRAFSNFNRQVCSAVGTPKLTSTKKLLTLIQPHGREVLGLSFPPGQVHFLNHNLHLELEETVASPGWPWH